MSVTSTGTAAPYYRYTWSDEEFEEWRAAKARIEFAQVSLRAAEEARDALEGRLGEHDGRQAARAAERATVEADLAAAEDAEDLDTTERSVVRLAAIDRVNSRAFEKRAELSAAVDAAEKEVSKTKGALADAWSAFIALVEEIGDLVPREAVDLVVRHANMALISRAFIDGMSADDLSGMQAALPDAVALQSLEDRPAFMAQLEEVRNAPAAADEPEPSEQEAREMREKADAVLQKAEFERRMNAGGQMLMVEQATLQQPAHLPDNYSISRI